MSPGVDGIAPKITNETVEQISTPIGQISMPIGQISTPIGQISTQFNMSLQEAIVPFEWKEANIISLLKKRFKN